MVSPAELGSQQQHFDGGRFGSVQDFKMCHFILWSNIQDGMECPHMELIQLPDVTADDSPRLTAIEQWCEDNSSVDFQFCGQGHIVVCEHPVAGSFNGLACHTDPCRDFLVKLSITWDHTSKVLEVLTVFRSTSSIVMVGWEALLFGAG